MIMGLFKTVDEKLDCLGFKKIEDSRNIVYYEKWDGQNEYTHRLLLTSGRGMPHIRSVKVGDNQANVPLSVQVTRLAVSKIKQKGWEGRIDG